MAEVLWPAMVLVGLYAVLGATMAFAIGVRGLWVVALAPAFATTVIGIASTVAPWFGMRWSLLPVALCAAVIAIGITAVRVVSGRRQPPAVGVPARTQDRNVWATAAIVGVAVVVLAWRTCEIIGEPQAISQTFDNVFHLNAIRYALDEGTASPLLIGQMTSPGGGVPFYPAVWHATGALLVQLSGASIPVAVNALTLVVAAVVWPVTAVLLARTLAGRSSYVTAAAALVATAVPAFPFLPMDYGVLYPYQLALALLPVALAATAAVLDIGGEGSQTGRGWWLLVLLGVLPGLALAHPGGFVGWLALSAPMIAVALWRRWGRGEQATWRRRVSVVVLAGGYVAIGVLLLKLLRPPLPTRQWPTITDPVTAVGDALTVSLFYPGTAFVAAVGVGLGIVWALLRRSPAAFVRVGMWAIGATLFVMVTSSSWGTLRDALTGSWYNNWQRLAALFAVALLPLAASGWASSIRWAIGRIRGTTALRVGSASVAFAVVLIAAQAITVTPAVAQARERFVMDEEAALISNDEMALLERLAEHVPADAVIAGNPYTGTSLAYAIADRRVLMPHILVDVSPEMAKINEHLAAADAAVCAAVETLDVGFVLDFGGREVHGGVNELQGLTDLEHSSAVRLIDREGDARLFEVVACGRD